jgi:hypothetical protein
MKGHGQRSFPYFVSLQLGSHCSRDALHADRRVACETLRCLAELAGQALLENILPQHIAESLVKREAKKRSRMEVQLPNLLNSCGLDDHLRSNSLLVDLALTSSPWPDSPSAGSAIMSQPAAQAQPASGTGKSTIDAMIAYKQWHPAVSILFAVSVMVLLVALVVRDTH